MTSDAFTYTLARTTYVNARALILQALDILDRLYHVGKYKQSQSVPVPPTPTATVVSAAVGGITETIADVTQKWK